MEKLKINQLLKFNPDQMSAVRQSYGYNSAQDVDAALDCLEDWISKQAHFVVKKFNRDYLERYLMMSKGSVERTKNHLDKLCTSRTLMPDYMRNLSSNIKKDFHDYFSMGYNCLVPKPTPESYRLYITKMHTDNYDKLSVDDYIKYMILMVDYILLNDYLTGLMTVIDLAHINMSLITKMSPMAVQKGRSIIIDGYGMRLKAIYIINSSKLLDTFVTIIKQGLNQKLRKRVHVLNKPEELQKYIPKNILPSDYGGDEKSVAELHDLTLKEFSSEVNVTRMQEMELAVTDESIRDTTIYNEEILGMPGSFKALSVD